MIGPTGTVRVMVATKPVDFRKGMEGLAALSIGSIDPLDQRYLDELKALVDRVQPLWVSDHLCFTGLRGHNMHDLLPLPYTEEALNHVAERVRTVQDRLGRRLVLENVSSYVTYAASELTEWDFIAELARRAIARSCSTSTTSMSAPSSTSSTPWRSCVPCGFLLPERYVSGADVSLGRFADLRVEAEVIFKMEHKLAGPGVTAATALPAVEGAGPSLELLDFVFSGKPRGTDFIANSIVAKATAIGGPLVPAQDIDLSREEVVYEHNGEIVGTYTSAEVMGNPLNALAWLANHLATRGLALEPGDLVMSGAISKMIRPKAGDVIRVRFARLGSVRINVVA